MKAMFTAARIAEERDFERRMKDGAVAKKAADDFRKAEIARIRTKCPQPRKLSRGSRVPRFRIAKAFKAGGGRLS